MNRVARLGGYVLLIRWWVHEGVPWLPGLIVFLVIVLVGVMWLA